MALSRWFFFLFFPFKTPFPPLPPPPGGVGDGEKKRLIKQSPNADHWSLSLWIPKVALASTGWGLSLW